LLLAEWQLTLWSPRLGAVTVYGHLAAFGSILISGFWSLVNERFDPRSAKKLIGRIGTGATIGGLAGGIFAAQAANVISVSSMLPLLSLAHLLCCLVLLQWFRARGSSTRGKEVTAGETPYRSGFQILKEQPYLQNLAALMLLGTVSAALLDYVFKAHAKASFAAEADSYLRLFAIYYAGVGLLSVISQSGLSRYTLERLGLARTVGTLPSAVALGSFGAFWMPTLLTTALARSAEAVLRNSLFRSAYEVLYTPLPLREKRATKSIIDVGFDRVGDAVGGGVTRLILTLGPQTANSFLLLMALLMGITGVVVARRLHKGYIRALERSLKAKAVELDLDEVEDRTTRQTVLLTMATLQLDSLVPTDLGIHDQKKPADLRPGPTELLSREVPPVVDKTSILLSGKAGQIRDILSAEQPLDPALVPHVINLLAWDETAPDAIRALRRTSASTTGQLIDALVDVEQDFSIRRRIPRVLANEPTQRSADGLMLGLQDQRFEVRFRCGRALARVREQNPELRLSSDEVIAAVLREVAVDRRVWESHRLLDALDDRDSLFVDRFLANRASRSLEHVFTILSLALPKEPLRIAYRGLHTDDRELKGTALEYLETILPESVRISLWPFLEAERTEPTTKSRDQILEELMKSNQSIEISLQQIRGSRDGSESK
jgi:hypothetical protein